MRSARFEAESTNHEYARKGFSVNAVAPGIIKSPMHGPESYGALAAFRPMGRMGGMSDIAKPILFHDSAPFVTGEILHVDGGMSAGHMLTTSRSMPCDAPVTTTSFCDALLINILSISGGAATPPELAAPRMP